MISRRGLIATGIAASLGAAAHSSTSRRFFGRDGRRIGINLYMVAGQVRKDLFGTLKTLAEIGYGEIETSLDLHDAAAIRTALDRTGLKCSSLNLLPTPMRGGKSLADDSGELAGYARLLGADFITCTMFPLPPGVVMRPQAGEAIEAMLVRITSTITTDDWKRTADYLNAKGAAFRRHGLRFAYHNHNVELAPHGETNGLSILLERTDPGLVSFHMDAGWVVAAGHDPCTILRAWPGRFRLMHVKDVAPGYRVNTGLSLATTEVGSGIIDWRRVLRVATDAGVRHFAVEQEPPYTMPQIESARRSFRYLSGLAA